MTELSEEKLKYLYMNDFNSHSVSPYRATYFFCKTSCICPEESKVVEIDDKLNDIIGPITRGNWIFILKPMICYLKPKVYFKPITMKALLYAVRAIDDKEILNEVVYLIKTHSQLNPPCKKEMKKYYEQIFLEKSCDIADDHCTNFTFGHLLASIIKLFGIDNDAIDSTDQHIAMSSTRRKRIKRIKFKKPVTFRRKRKIESLDDVKTPEDIESSVKLYGTVKDISSLPEFNLNHENQKDKERSAFLAFELMLDLIEQDLYIWLLDCRSFNDSSNNPDNWPLLFKIVWNKNLLDLGKTNDRCRETFEIFKECSSDYKLLVARYICLISEIVRLSEKNTEMRYPYFGEKCETFAKELFDHISNDSSHEEMYEFVQVLCPHWLRFLVSCHVLNITLSSSSIYSLGSILRILQRNLSPVEFSNKIDQTSDESAISTLAEEFHANRTNHAGETVIHRLCRQNKSEKLEQILRFEYADVNIQNNGGWAPLHEAANHNSVACIKLLIKYRHSPKSGAKQLLINISSNDGFTPLMDAIKSGNMDAVTVLLQHGAASSIYNKCESGENAINLAENDTDLINLLMGAWNTSISSYEYLHMTDSHVKIFHNLLVSYCKVYHIKDSVLDDNNTLETNRSNSPLKIDYSQYLDDNKHFSELCALVERLSNNSKNTSHLKAIFAFTRMKNLK